MREFGRIESLIGYEVKKMPLPEAIGRGPNYDPKGRAKSGGPGGNGHRRRWPRWPSPERRLVVAVSAPGTCLRYFGQHLHSVPSSWRPCQRARW
jgi:hypothetical protein